MVLLLAKLLGFIVLSILVGFVRAHLARRRRAEIRTGGTASCRAVLCLDDGKFHRGTLLMSGASATWRSARRGETVELRGARVLAAGEATQRQARSGDVLLRLTLPDSAVARMLVNDSDAATFVEVLARSEAPSPDAVLRWFDPPPVARWALACLALAAAWVLTWVVVVVTGNTVTATVAGVTGDGLCTVTWTDGAGRGNRDEIECADVAVGSDQAAWALGWPATGDLEDPEATVSGVLVVGTLVAAPGAISLLLRRRRRRRPTSPAVGRSATPPRVFVPDQDAPALSVDDVRPYPGDSPTSFLGRLAPYAIRQLARDGWENPGLPAGSEPPQLAGRLLRALVRPGAVLVAVVVVAWLYTGSWYVLATASATTTAAGTSTGAVTSESHWPLPDRVTVKFRTSDRAEHVVDVATLRPLPAGTSVTVEYALADPDAVRLVGPADGLGRTLALTLGALALTLAWAIRCARAATARFRTVRTTEEKPPNPVFGLLTGDPAGRPLLLVCAPVVQPVQLYAVPLEAPLPHGVAALFAAAGGTELRIRGRLADGETVVPEIGTLTLRPAGPAWRPDTEQLVGLLDSVGTLVRTVDRDDTDPGDDGTSGDR